MQIQKFGHSCLLADERGARVILDPGRFSHGLSHVQGLNGILITHSHDDHLCVENIRELLLLSPKAVVVCDEGSAPLLHENGIDCRIVHAGDEINLGIGIKVFGSKHAIVHPDWTNIPNVGYLVGMTLYYSGDAFDIPDVDVDVLALPVSASWMKLGEAIDFVRAINPRVVIPVHDHGGGFNDYVRLLLDSLGPKGTVIEDLNTSDLREI